MTETLRITKVLRSWELPLAVDQESAAVEAILVYGQKIAMNPGDLALCLGRFTEQWEFEGATHLWLRQAVDAALQFTPAVLAAVDAKAYFEMYEKLRSGGGDVASLSHTISRRLLSRTSLIAHLLGEERFSCSQVARLLAANEASLDVPHGAISVIARKLGLLPGLDRTTAGPDLWVIDQALSLVLFPDSSLAETSLIAALEVDTWLPEADMERLLNRLGESDEPDREPFWPYFQMLHWCLTPVEFFDHPASFLYEFGPRGYVGLDLFSKYPTVTGNPILNNAKAVQTLNSTWARNRGGDNAHALVELLSVIESLPFVPRREVARVLRAWLIRIIELRTVTPVKIELEITEEVFGKTIAYVTANETNTQGVIEQRVVDCLSMLAFEKEGWRVRGLGDGVNASNFSRHKLGDIEFANVDNRTAIAVEAHGGHLSSTYVYDHARSLGRIIKQRLEESWGNLDRPEVWTIKVLFVAHSQDPDEELPANEILHGVNVSYEYINYDELVARASISSSAADRTTAFDQHVLKQLNAETVRETVRQKFRVIIASEA